MTNAAKKAATPRKKATVKPAPEATPPTPPPVDIRHQSPAMGEEMRTANLIAVLALGPDAWANLYAAGVDEDAAEAVAIAVAERLGLTS